MNDEIHLNIKHKPALPALFTLFSTLSFSSVFSSLLNPSLAFCGDQYRGAKAAGGTENRRTSTWEMSESCCQNTRSRHTPARIILWNVTVSDRARAVEVCGEVNRPVWRDAVRFIHCIQTASDDSQTTESPDPQWQDYHLRDLQTRVVHTTHT